MGQKDTVIKVCKNGGMNAEELKKGLVEALFTANDILLLSEGCTMPAKKIAEGLYTLVWLLQDCEIVDEQE